MDPRACATGGYRVEQESDLSVTLGFSVVEHFPRKYNPLFLYAIEAIILADYPYFPSSVSKNCGLTAVVPPCRATRHCPRYFFDFAKEKKRS